MSSINAVTEGEHQVFKLSEECVIPQTRLGRTCGGYPSNLIISTADTLYTAVGYLQYCTFVTHSHTPHIHRTYVPLNIATFTQAVNNTLWTTRTGVHFISFSVFLCAQRSCQQNRAETKYLSLLQCHGPLVPSLSLSPLILSLSGVGVC